MPFRIVRNNLSLDRALDAIGRRLSEISRRRCMRNAKGSRAFRIHDTVHLRFPRIWDLNTFEIPFGFQMPCGPPGPRSRGYLAFAGPDLPLGRPLSFPSPAPCSLRYRASTTWALESIGRAPASCALDFGIGIKRFDRFARSRSVHKLHISTRRVQSTANLKVLYRVREGEKEKKKEREIRAYYKKRCILSDIFCCSAIRVA